MRRSVIVAMASGVAMTALHAAPGADYARSPAELMARFDGDGDGRVIEAEYVAYLSLGFRARDVDGDGVLQAGELPPDSRPITKAANEARLRRQFARQDGNGDGALDAGELLAPPRG